MKPMDRKILALLQNSGPFGVRSDRLAAAIEDGWGRDMVMSNATLHVHIHALRRAGHEILCIRGRRGRGNGMGADFCVYRLVTKSNSVLLLPHDDAARVPKNQGVGGAVARCLGKAA